MQERKNGKDKQTFLDQKVRERKKLSITDQQIASQGTQSEQYLWAANVTYHVLGIIGMHRKRAFSTSFTSNGF